MNDRIEKIISMLERTPNDTFLHYSLGMEYISAERFDDAVDSFQKCVELDENYLAAYVECGKALRSAARLDEARQVFSQAMELAVTQGESHMRDFIQQQLDALPKD